MSKFKKGDKVIIILPKLNNVENTESNLYFHPNMHKYIGRKVTITEVLEHYSPVKYKIKEDNGDWLWDDYCFERIKVDNWKQRLEESK
jgi:predicted HTH transcriptional regulator